MSGRWGTARWKGNLSLIFVLLEPANHSVGDEHLVSTIVMFSSGNGNLDETVRYKWLPELGRLYISVILCI